MLITKREDVKKQFRKQEVDNMACYVGEKIEQPAWIPPPLV
jgi:hypothetical protein